MSGNSGTTPTRLGKVMFEAESLGRKLRNRVLPRFAARHRALRDHLTRVFSHEAIDCVLDVGANRGQFYQVLRHEMGYDGLIASFDPLADLAGRLAPLAQYLPTCVVF